MVRLLLWYVAVALSLVLIALARRYVTGFDPVATLAPPLLPQLLGGLAASSIPAVLVGAVLSLFQLVRAVARPAAALAGLWVTWTVLLVASALLAGLPITEAEPTRVVLPVARLVRADDHRVYAVERDGVTYGPIVIRPDGREGFSIRPEGTLGPTGVLRMGGGDPVHLDISRSSGSYASLVRATASLAALAHELDVVRAAVTPGDDSFTVMINLAGLSIFLLGCWTLVRLTRWPLFNAVLVFAALRSAVWLFASASEGMVRDLLASSSIEIPYASGGLLGVLGVSLLVVVVLLPSIETWKRDLTDG